MGLHAFDGVVWTLPWVATMHYGYTIAPANLMATMTATIACVEFIIGEKNLNFKLRYTLNLFLIQLRVLQAWWVVKSWLTQIWAPRSCFS